MLPKVCFVICCVVMLPLAPGCRGGANDQPEVGAVSGIVTIDGQPAANLQVIFTPKEGRPSQGITDAKGHYVLNYLGDVAGAKIGTHKVQITTLEISQSDRVEDLTPFKETIPAAYNTETTLTADVKAGENTFNFELQIK